MPKEKSINPAQAQRKAEKAKAVKKGTYPICYFSAPPFYLRSCADSPQAKPKPKPAATRNSHAETLTASKNSSTI
jgi:hypothetical protein